MEKLYGKNFMEKVDDLNGRAYRTYTRRTSNPETLIEEKKALSNEKK